MTTNREGWLTEEQVSLIYKDAKQGGYIAGAREYGDPLQDVQLDALQALCRMALAALERQDGVTDQLLLRVLAQSIGVRPNGVTLDHSFISAYEEACEWVEAKGYGAMTDTGAILKADPFDDQALAAPASPVAQQDLREEAYYVNAQMKALIEDALAHPEVILSAWNTRAPIPATPGEDRVREAAVWLCSCVDKARRSGFGLEHEELLDLVEQVEEALSKEQAALAATKEGR